MGGSIILVVYDGNAVRIAVYFAAIILRRYRKSFSADCWSPYPFSRRVSCAMGFRLVLDRSHASERPARGGKEEATSLDGCN